MYKQEGKPQMPNYRKPEQVATLDQLRALQARVEALEKGVQKDDGKEALVEQAVELGLGAKSTLSRWSIEKLTTEIDKAK